MKLKIDWYSLFTLPLIMMITHLLILTVWEMFIRDRSALSILLGIVCYSCMGLTGWCMYLVQKDGNWLVANPVHTIDHRGKSIVLNDKYKMRWIRKIRYNENATCVNFITRTIWLQRSARACLCVKEKEERRYGQ